VKAVFVTKRLAFGSAITKWRHVEQLRELGITHVINLRRVNNKKIRQFKWLWLPFEDNKKPRPRWFYGSALKFHEAGDCLRFIHCLGYAYRFHSSAVLAKPSSCV
jgi:hypothetical protein